MRPFSFSMCPIQDDTFHLLPPKTEERCLLELFGSMDFSSLTKFSESPKILAFSTGRAQAADWIAQFDSRIEVSVWYLDAHHASNAVSQTRLHRGQMPDNLIVLCLADAPEQSYDVAFATLSSSGESELARDIVQQLYHRLKLDGKLFVSVDNPQDTWVHELLKPYEKKVRVDRFADGTVYQLNKTHELKKQKDYSCQLAFRDCDELIQFVTRPGVFSHRQLDNGARQLLDAIDVYPEAKILEIGCGSGSVSLGLAKRDPSAKIHAVDSNARALDCLRRGMDLNGITNITMELNHDGHFEASSGFDMVVANPPYYADFKIASKFLTSAHHALRPGGRLVVVTKQPRWYEENMDQWFVDHEVFPSKRYFIASGVKS